VSDEIYDNQYLGEKILTPWNNFVKETRTERQGPLGSFVLIVPWLQIFSHQPSIAIKCS
jgi:hypothetical protein